MADIRISLNGVEGLYKIVTITSRLIFVSPIESPTISSNVSALVKNDMDEWVVLGSSEPYTIEFLRELPTLPQPTPAANYKSLQSRIVGKTALITSTIPGKRIYPIEPKRAPGLAFGGGREGMMDTSSGFGKPGQLARFSGGGFSRSSGDEQMEEVN